MDNTESTINPSQLEVANSRLQSFGSMIGLNDLSFDEDAECCLSIDNTYKVLLTALPTQILLESEVGKFEEAYEITILRDIAAANFRWFGTRGATLGVNMKTKTLQLCRAIDTEFADQMTFATVFEQFLASVEFWTKRCAKIAAGEEINTPGIKENQGSSSLLPTGPPHPLSGRA